MRTVAWTASAVVCFTLGATGASARMDSLSLPQRDMPIGLGMPKPDDSPDPKTAYEDSRDLLAAEKFEAAIPLLQAVVIDGCDELKNLETEIAAYKAAPPVSKKEIAK